MAAPTLLRAVRSASPRYLGTSRYLGSPRGNLGTPRARSSGVAPGDPPRDPERTRLRAREHKEKRQRLRRDREERGGEQVPPPPHKAWTPKPVVEYEHPLGPDGKKATGVPLPPSYSPRYVEAAWSGWWERGGFFTPPQNPEGGSPMLSMVLPPPNVTGSLHLGHALGVTLQDAIARWHGDQILQQLRALGASLDWSRCTFTMDPGVHRFAARPLVVEALANRGLFRGSQDHPMTLPLCRYHVQNVPKCPQCPQVSPMSSSATYPRVPAAVPGTLSRSPVMGQELRDRLNQRGLDPRELALATEGQVQVTDWMSRWILSRLAGSAQEVSRALAALELQGALLAIQTFWLRNFCDVYLEASKPRLCVQDVRVTLLTCADLGLRLLAPFAPFLAEELWQRLPHPPGAPPTLGHAPFPVHAHMAHWCDPRLEADVAAMLEVVRAARGLRDVFGLRGARPPVAVRCPAPGPDWLSALGPTLQALAGAGSLKLLPPGAEPPMGPGWVGAPAGNDTHVFIGLQVRVRGDAAADVTDDVTSNKGAVIPESDVLPEGDVRDDVTRAPALGDIADDVTPEDDDVTDDVIAGEEWPQPAQPGNDVTDGITDDVTNDVMADPPEEGGKQRGGPGETPGTPRGIQIQIQGFQMILTPHRTRIHPHRIRFQIRVFQMIPTPHRTLIPHRIQCQIRVFQMIPTPHRTRIRPHRTLIPHRIRIQIRVFQMIPTPHRTRIHPHRTLIPHRIQCQIRVFQMIPTPHRTQIHPHRTPTPHRIQCQIRVFQMIPTPHRTQIHPHRTPTPHRIRIQIRGFQKTLIPHRTQIHPHGIRIRVFQMIPTPHRTQIHSPGIQVFQKTQIHPHGILTPPKIQIQVFQRIPTPHGIRIQIRGFQKILIPLKIQIHPHRIPTPHKPQIPHHGIPIPQRIQIRVFQKILTPHKIPIRHEIQIPPHRIPTPHNPQIPRHAIPLPPESLHHVTGYPGPPRILATRRIPIRSHKIPGGSRNPPGIHQGIPVTRRIPGIPYSQGTPQWIPHSQGIPGTPRQIPVT
ncbi:hypothetical protein Q9233_017578 [Columba guinea]|nr:hypothetical protein Q9233_017578 [Columba guinea]